MRPRGSATVLENRRRRAALLSRQGHGIRAIARRVHASPGSVHRWIHDWKQSGDVGLDAKPLPRRSGKLSSHQREGLKKLIQAKSMDPALAQERLTLQKLATLIDRELGVKYHPSHLWRILQDLGWKFEISQKRATRGDKREALAHRIRRGFPNLKW